MTREFIMLPMFEKQWSKIGLTEDDLKRLQNELIKNPKVGDVVQGTGGLRKIRFAFEHHGKSGSTRVVYVDFAYYEKIYFITAYAKNDKENLSKSERNNIKTLIQTLEKNLKGE
ncbi:MAG: type II toxin-antitoxin system RelE/ParE family toxin [Oscillospiraceae bacterium]|nr:type II toxin-antitoxin system RelE/ParE family toxin [Oscillospiraceae bacterium]MDE6657443.1 type II toxin-antitoxin system RelE/ParE family toxin [Oscillospiraceae bacterium]